MKAQPSFFSAVRQCLLDSVRIGLIVSVLLSCIVMVLGNIAQANDVQEVESNDSQFVMHPDEMHRGSLLFKDEHKYQSAPVLQTVADEKIGNGVKLSSSILSKQASFLPGASLPGTD